MHGQRLVRAVAQRLRLRYDYKMSSEPEGLILHLLREVRVEIGDMRQQMATKDDLKALRDELKSDIGSLRADVAADFVTVRHEISTVRKELSEQIVGLRRAVIEYHTSVIGHGILISDLEARMRRVEQHLGLFPPDMQ
jgi:ribosomal protein L29